MGDKTIDRVQAIIDHYGISRNAFDASIGKANGYIGKQIKRRASIGSDTIETILLTYRDISPAWLIAGEGEMLRKEELKQFEEHEPEYSRVDYFEQMLLKYLDKPQVRDKIYELLNQKPELNEEED